MKIKIIFALTAIVFSGSVFAQAPPPDTSDITFLNCNTNGIGNNSSNPNAPGQRLDTRRGNNGKGNGGESFDVYANFVNGESFPPQITVECIKTADEDTVGTVYVKLPTWTDYVATGSTDREFDPGKLGSMLFF